ncbi:MAG: FIST C-terminal domain-containing protein [Proteobacteria bacterium]|nr:FIST C-terminal domain-containing protein [Pseudomonadota bacterium]
MQIVNLTRPEMETWHGPKYLIVYTTQSLDLELLNKIHSELPSLIIWGLSSFHGILLSDGFKRGIYGLLIEDEDNLELRVTAIDLSHTQNIREHVSEHLRKWGADYPNARSFFIHGTQGTEERTIEAIHDVFSPSAQVFGATAGYDKFLTEPFIFLNDTIISQGVLIIQMLNNRFVCSIACGGYMPTLNRGIVTASHGRVLESIDNRPAVDVYNEWTDGMFEPYFKRGGMLPRSCGLYPLGRTMPNEPDCGFWLCHPYFIDPDAKSIHLFSEVPQGAEIQLMRGTESSIITHIGNVIKNALEQVEKSSVQAALIMFCAGSASIIADGMEIVCEQAKDAFGSIPFIGCTTYGEQGRLKNASQDYHGNMMIEIVLLLKHIPAAE